MPSRYSDVPLPETQYVYATEGEAAQVFELLTIDGYEARHEGRDVFTNAPSCTMRRVHRELEDQARALEG